MLIPQPPPPKQTSALALKPQLHTHKNHHTYNGAHQLPQSTHVRVIPDQSINNTTTNRTTTHTTRSTHKTKTKKPDPPTPRYTITLHYPHNRACELYRTAHDIDILRRALGVLAHPIPIPPPQKGNGSSSSSSSSSGSTTTTTITATTTTATEGRSQSQSPTTPYKRTCKRTCSCECLCAAQEKGREAREAAGVQLMLGQALARMAAGDARVGVAMEWVLRRRLGDCGGR